MKINLFCTQRRCFPLEPELLYTIALFAGASKKLEIAIFACTSFCMINTNVIIAIEIVPFIGKRNQNLITQYSMNVTRCRLVL